MSDTVFRNVGPLVFEPFTTAERDALNAKPGMFIWNIETGQFEVYYGGGWRGLLLLDTAGKITAAHHGQLWNDLHKEYGQVAVPEVITAAWVLGEGGSLRGIPGNPPLGELAPPRKTTTGAPTHSAGLGSLCYVEPDDDLYQNNDGGTGWTKVSNGGGGAPVGAQYLVLALHGTLTGERRFVPGTGLTGSDGGADGNYTLNHDTGLTSLPVGHIMRGTAASRPAAATAGKFYYATNRKVLYGDTGSAWEVVSAAVPVSMLYVPGTIPHNQNDLGDAMQVLPDIAFLKNVYARVKTAPVAGTTIIRIVKNGVEIATDFTFAAGSNVASGTLTDVQALFAQNDYWTFNTKGGGAATLPDNINVQLRPA